MRLILLGFACNNACVFCAQGELRAETELSLRPGKVEAELAAITAGETVAFVGGEPTLCEDLPAWIKEAEARGAARIVVQTNARRLAYRGYAAALREASARLTLDASLHGSSAPMHDYHTDTPGSFGQTVRGLKHAQLEGIAVGVTTVVTRSNFRHLSEVARLAGALGAQAIQFSMASRFGRAARAADRVIPTAALVAPQVARAVSEAAAMGLAWRAGDREGGQGAAAWFAGMGPVEEGRAEEVRDAAQPRAVAERAPHRVSLPMLGRAMPARAESRSRERRTGSELRQILPGLFNAERSGGEHTAMRGEEGAG
ncbi:radical SAM protein [Chondromyces apiculatus]|uniref:Radical SAM core domain-containing protein n=1 Tax=Chondromyces apiculatus DSM 436 TaxID=1192034 RepID=A0A017TAP9_9BACT|nr:radical SAM protein [Chondromyces apiculatus]EYF06314.1 Hypothetical protein CAP_2192 [Chondromyces apiculatus DSM 436]